MGYGQKQKMTLHNFFHSAIVSTVNKYHKHEQNSGSKEKKFTMATKRVLKKIENRI